MSFILDLSLSTTITSVLSFVEEWSKENESADDILSNNRFNLASVFMSFEVSFFAAQPSNTLIPETLRLAPSKPKFEVWFERTPADNLTITYTQELCCEISYVASFLLCLLFFAVFVVVNICLFFLLFLWIFFFFFLFSSDNSGKVFITDERPEAATSSLSTDIP